MGRAVGERDADGLRRHAHELGPSSRMLGAEELAGMATEIETEILGACRWPELEARTAAVQGAWPEVRAALEGFAEKG